jgi:hypothetical protein
MNTKREIIDFLEAADWETLSDIPKNVETKDAESNWRITKIQIPDILYQTRDKHDYHIKPLAPELTEEQIKLAEKYFDLKGMVRKSDIVNIQSLIKYFFVEGFLLDEIKTFNERFSPRYLINIDDRNLYGRKAISLKFDGGKTGYTYGLGTTNIQALQNILLEALKTVLRDKL